MNDEDGEDGEDKPSILCTNCGHDLDNAAILVCTHPKLPVPVCILCHDEFEELFVEGDDLCSWCAQEAENLVLCGGESSTCPHGFCEDCLRTHLGEDQLAIILSGGDWLCLCCDPSPRLDKFTASLEFGAKRSMYLDSMIGSGVAVDENDSENEVKIEREVYIYRALIVESNLATKMLEDDNISSVRISVATEIERDGRDSADITAEISEYMSQWQRHYDIMQRQEAESEQLLRDLRVDVLDVHKSLFQETEPAIYLENENAQFDKIRLFQASIDAHKRDSPTVSLKLWSDFREVISDDAPSTYPLNLTDYSTDPFVTLYNSYKPVPENRYPKSFERSVPRAVLKALYYCRHSRDNQELANAIARFNIPPEIIIVMKYAAVFTSYDKIAMLPFCKEYHPAICKVFVESVHQSEWHIICQGFGISEEFCECDDIGDDNVNLYEDRILGRRNESDIKRLQIQSIEASESEAYHNYSAQYWSSCGKFASKADRTIAHVERRFDDATDKIEDCELSKPRSYGGIKRPRQHSDRVRPLGDSSKSSESKARHPSVAQAGRDVNSPPNINGQCTSYPDNFGSGTDHFMEEDYPSYNIESPRCSAVGPQMMASRVEVLDLTLGDSDDSETSTNDESDSSDIANTDSDDESLSRRRRLKRAKLCVQTENNSGRIRNMYDWVRPIIDVDEDNSHTTGPPVVADHFRQDQSGLLNDPRPGHEPAIYLPTELLSHLKDHQLEGVKFIWNNIMNAQHAIKKRRGKMAATKAGKSRGCILAHCMGLGKTLQIVTLVITLLANPAMEYFSKDVSIATSSSSEVPEKKCLFENVLILGPVNIIHNWIAEFRKWVPKALKNKVKECIIVADDSLRDRVEKLRMWKAHGGVLIMGYPVFVRLCAEPTKYEKEFGKEAGAAIYSEVEHYLRNPGPDLVVADEAHVIKDGRAKISELLGGMHCDRRIALTGSPIQNNLEEYYFMVNWVKPLHLGRLKEFQRRFIIPIRDGEHSDATPKQVNAMKRRAHVLFAKLESIVNRRDITTLANDLPSKREFVVSLKMTDIQIKLYNSFLGFLKQSFGKRVLFVAFQNLLRIWNHPGVAMLSILENEKRNPSLQAIAHCIAVANRAIVYESTVVEDIGHGEAESAVEIVQPVDTLSEDDNTIIEVSFGHESEASTSSAENELQAIYSESRSVSSVVDPSDIYEIMDSNDEDENPEVNAAEPLASEPSLLDNGSNPQGNSIIDWWKSINENFGMAQLEHEELRLINLSSKFIALIFILLQSVEIGDKVLLFSQSLPTLDFIEMILRTENWGQVAASFMQVSDPRSVQCCSRWKLNRQYLRIDGTVKLRQELIDKFNEPTSTHKLFLISTRAGNMGINLHAANRVIIFDSSWNPANDLQAIYRSYRYGQKKNVFVYRLLAAGSMEEKIYRKQIQKQALSARVIDAQMPDNHYSVAEKAELLTFQGDGKLDTQAVSDALAVLEQGTKDKILISFVKACHSIINSIEDQGELLKDNELAHLTEAEQLAAEEDYELEEAMSGPQDGPLEANIAPESLQPPLSDAVQTK